MPKISKARVLRLFKRRIGGAPFILHCPGMVIRGNTGKMVIKDIVEARHVKAVRSKSVIFTRPDDQESYLYLESGDTYELDGGVLRITNGGGKTIEYHDRSEWTPETQTEQPMIKIRTESITLSYTCDECKAVATQSLSEIVESGTAVCPNCDTDMVLDDTIRVQTE